jgi:hypothetical protein
MPSAVPIANPVTARAPPSATTTSFPQSSNAESSPLPAPNTFDLLPPLHDILLRVLDAPADPSLAAAGQPDSQGPLEPARLPDATLTLKRKIQKAREAVERIPDVGRTVEEQEEEIQALEERVKRLRGVLESLGKMQESTRDEMKMEE